MTHPEHDGQLVNSYATQGSESAFKALVARHVDMVFATALRQVGDSGLAEEITQNVFVVMARKAPRLSGYETLAGWLHRTTVLEARARVRSELRRRKREDQAAQMAQVRNEGVSPLEPALPLLDEALLNLREVDRLALVSRFLEDRTFREVGRALGVNEEAARKRVSRALDQLAHFFRRRGFALPGGAGAAALLSQGVQAAPAGLLAASSQAAILAGPKGTSLLFYIMSLSKTQTAVIVSIVAAGSLLWQETILRGAAAQQSSLASTLLLQQESVAALATEDRRLQDELAQISAERLLAESQATFLARRTGDNVSTTRYHWDDSSPLARFPKSLLPGLGISSVQNRQGWLSPQIKETLQLTPHEITQAEAALANFLQAAHSAQAQVMTPPAPVPDPDQEESRVFEFGDANEYISPARAALYAELEPLLGPERFRLFREGLSSWMPTEDFYQFSPGLSSSQGVFHGPHTITFHRPEPGQPFLNWGVKTGKSSFGAPIMLEDIPELYAEYLQDWIDLARTKPNQLPIRGTAASPTNAR